MPLTSHTSQSPLGPAFEKLVLQIDAAFAEKDFKKCQKLLLQAEDLIDLAQQAKALAASIVPETGADEEPH